MAVAAVGSLVAVLCLRRVSGRQTSPKKAAPDTATADAAPCATKAAPWAPVPPVPTDEPMALEERARAMELLQVLKQRANGAFQEGLYEDALLGYQDCISITSALGARDREAVAAEQVIRANVVMAFIKQHQYADARLVATMLLQEDADRGCPVDPDLKVKVLYRRGLASKALGEKEAALADFKAAVQLSPAQKNVMAEREIALLSK